MSLKSMTGFARIRSDTTAGEVTLTVKSVNHRGLDLHFHLPLEFEPFEPALRSAARKRIARGHVDIRLSVKSSSEGVSGSLNRPLLDAWLGAFREAAGDHGLGCSPDLNAALAIPGMFRERERGEPDAGLEAELVAALNQALQLLDEFRVREGSEICSELLARGACIREAVIRLEQLRDGILPAIEERLRDRIATLMRGIAIDQQRIAQEVALLADRSDIGEELARLRIHSRHLDELIQSSGETGKKLDFLLQEMNREINTLLAKTANAGQSGLPMTELALAVRADVEKIREQSLNIE